MPFDDQRKIGLFSLGLVITVHLLFLLYLGSSAFESWFYGHRSLVSYNKNGHFVIFHSFCGSGIQDRPQLSHSARGL